MVEIFSQLARMMNEAGIICLFAGVDQRKQC
jgi:hypothetical protein